MRTLIRNIRIFDGSGDALAAHNVFYGPGCGVSVAALEASPPLHIDMSAMKASAAHGTGNGAGATA